MTVALETKRVFGETIVVALVRNEIERHQSGYHLAVTGGRSPVALLIKTGDQIDAFTPQGDPLTMSQIQALCPDVVADLMSTEFS